VNVSRARNAFRGWRIGPGVTTRSQLDTKRINPKALEKMGAFHADVISEVEAAVAKHDLVVVGMAGNPHVKAVRKALSEAGVTFEYLEYGSYFSEWRKRLAIKMWSGWPTFPQVFARGTLLGGRDLTEAALADGTLRAAIAGNVARA